MITDYFSSFIFLVKKNKKFKLNANLFSANFTRRPAHLPRPLHPVPRSASARDAAPLRSFYRAAQVGPVWRRGRSRQPSRKSTTQLGHGTTCATIESERKEKSKIIFDGECLKIKKKYKKRVFHCSNHYIYICVFLRSKTTFSCLGRYFHIF